MKSFDTYEKAKKHLELKRKYLYHKINKKGDKILGDYSFVCREFFAAFNGEERYVAYMQITTQSLIDDLVNFENIDCQKLEMDLLWKNYQKKIGKN